MQYSQADCLPFSNNLFPLRKGKYEVIAGLSPLKGEVFERDNRYDHYQAQKRLCFNEDKNKYLCLDNEYLKNESEYMQFLNICANHSYANTEELTLNTQEDFAIIKGDKAVAISLCFPNHWDPREKISKNFNDIHIPVADFGPIAKNAQRLCRSMIERGPFKRYAWGLATDTRLNHHPEAPKDILEKNWQGRYFINDGKHQLYMRIEKQHMVGLPKLDSFLFTIKTYFLNVSQIPVGELILLRDAIASMTAETMTYKGILNNKDEIKSYLNLLIEG